MAESQPKAPPPPPPLDEDVLGIYRRVFFRGLATILPTLLTLWVISSVYGFIDERIATPITSAIKSRLVATESGNRIADALFDFPDKSTTTPITGDSQDARDREAARKRNLAVEIDKRFPSWVGFVLAIVGVFIVGFFIASFVGRTLWRVFEGWLGHIPIVKSVYPGAKQMVEFLLKSEESRRSWSTVVAVEYPRKGIWAIGYITGPGIAKVEER
ncbi:DUF502 domain-containing protein, partial [bacterium]|nr:DUF502 domain-containing protein [bacterium]